VSVLGFIIIVFLTIIYYYVIIMIDKKWEELIVVNNSDLNKQYDLYKYVFIDENNVEKEYEILLSFKSEKYNKIFFVMTDNLMGENNKLNTYAFYIDSNQIENENIGGTFNPVIDNEELKYVDEVFNNVQRGEL